MIGYHIFPEAARERIPGQVPRLVARKTGAQFDPEVDPSKPAPAFTMKRYWAETRPIMRVTAVAENLGLSLTKQKDIQRLVKNHVGINNELKFRQGLMGSLLQQRYDPTLRKTIMSRALDYYRRQPGPKKRTLQQRIWKSEIDDKGSPDTSQVDIDIEHTEVKRKKLVVPTGNIASMRAKEEPRDRDSVRGEGDEDRSQTVTPQMVVTLPNPVEELKQKDSTFDAVKAKKARGGKYHRRVTSPDGKHKYYKDEKAYNKRPDAHLSGGPTRSDYLKQLVRKLVCGDEHGCHIEKLAPLISKYGTKEIAQAIRALGDYHVNNGRVHMITRSARKSLAPVRYIIELPLSEPLSKQMAPVPAMAAAPGGAGGRAIGGTGGGSAPTPVGTKKVWGNRIVEKKADGKWHVVSHIAGLEGIEGEKVPHKIKQAKEKHGEIKTEDLSREQAAHLITQLKGEKGKSRPAK